MRGDLSLRGSLRSRLLGMSALVSLCAIVATVWLVVSLTAVAIGRERGQVLSDDARLYDSRVGFAATHPDWNGVAPTVRALGRQTGRQITLTDEGRHLLANSASRDGSSGRSLPAGVGNGRRAGGRRRRHPPPRRHLLRPYRPARGRTVPADQQGKG
ncbi:hypothetical protein AQI94_29160 [Streptomyces pseudovenezuelae]|uniref:Uncharacterized protein n=1 Tax=Streptomyces pseudovenezuelae TaxID=67350 RepID=A0A101N162_9ACTN|nr:hypothetical protein AQI94_29160 [Streptomyces pseudovenezuelae]